jgi:cytochrome P450
MRILFTSCPAHGHFLPLVPLAWADPGPDLISTLLLATDEGGGGKLTGEELRSNLFVLLIGGYETTTNFIGNGILALLTDPPQWDLLRRRPERAADAVEELLRFDGSVKTSFRLFPTEPVLVAPAAGTEGR